MIDSAQIANCLQYADEVAAGCALVAFAVLSISAWRKREMPSLEAALRKGMAAGAIPISLTLMACALNMDLFQKITGANVYLAFAGHALLCSAIEEIFEMKRGRQAGHAASA